MVPVPIPLMCRTRLTPLRCARRFQHVGCAGRTLIKRPPCPLPLQGGPGQGQDRAGVGDGVPAVSWRDGAGTKQSQPSSRLLVVQLPSLYY